MIETRPLRRWFLAGMALVAAVGAGVLALATLNGGEPSTDLFRTVAAAGPEDEINWNSPMLAAIPARDEAEAAATVDFPVALPDSTLGAPQGVFVNDPEVVPRAERAVAWVFNHPTFGRFAIYELTNETTTEKLLKLLDSCSPSICEGEAVTLKDGTSAVVLANPGRLRSIGWILGGVRITAIGPEATFTRDHAIAVANLVRPPAE